MSEDRKKAVMGIIPLLLIAWYIINFFMVMIFK
jgi:hypothetical protein